MTESEIMQSLECCTSNRARDLLDLINRKNAEIENLTINMNAFGLGMKREKERADNARAEAIKEFAERVKKTNRSVAILRTSHIDQIAKEMEEADQ